MNDPAHGPLAAGNSDERLLERLSAGTDESALTQLYDRYQAQMYGLALSITKDNALAQDAVQEAFVNVWRNAGRYSPGRGSVRTWLLSIAHHRAIDTLRRRRAITPLPDGEEVFAGLVAPDVWPEVAQAVDRELINKALIELSAEQRQVIELAYFGGLTQSEIAAQVGIPLGTVKSRARLGLRALRRELEEWQ